MAKWGRLHSCFFAGRTMDINTKTTLHSMKEKAERILTEKLAVMQSQLEVSQNAAPPLEEQAKTLTSLQAVPEKYQSMLIPSENVEASRKQDLEILRAEMGVRISKDLEAAKRSWTKEILLEMETKLGEHGNSHECLCLTESQNYVRQMSSIE